jgi:hypothetical protein
MSKSILTRARAKNKGNKIDSSVGGHYILNCSDKHLSHLEKAVQPVSEPVQLSLFQGGVA